MTATVCLGYAKQRQKKRNCNDLLITGNDSLRPEMTGESEEIQESPVHIDSEDSAAPKRKCISLNGKPRADFGAPMEVYSVKSMSILDKKRLEMRLRLELQTTRDMQRKISTMGYAGSAIPFSKQHGKHHGSQGKRGSKGKFQLLHPHPPAGGSRAGGMPMSMMMKQCEALLKKVMTHKSSWIFNTPVDVVKFDIPDYFDIIKHPMDLGTVKKKLTAGAYLSPLEFAADVRLTFNNALTYNPPTHNVHRMAEMMSKFFESRWKNLEKKLVAVDASSLMESEMSLDLQPKRSMPTPVNIKADLLESGKPMMLDEEKQKLGELLQSLGEDLPTHVVDFLKRWSGNVDQLGDGEMEIDFNSISDDKLLELKKLIDDFCLKREKCRPAKSGRSDVEIEALNVSGVSNPQAHPDKVIEAVDEDVDICGNSPVVVKDELIRTLKSISPGSSSSDSDSDSDSSSGSESGHDVASPAGARKGEEKLEIPAAQEKSDVVSSFDAKRLAIELDPQKQDTQSKITSEGENTKPERQVSPDKLYRAALLRSRFADTISKARQTLQGESSNDILKQQQDCGELEQREREERERLLAEAKAVTAARRAKVEAEAKRQRELEREAARQALQKMERTVEIDDGHVLKDLELLRAAPAEPILSSVGETSPEQSLDGLQVFVPGGGNALEQLGLFMKQDDEEEEYEPGGSAPMHQDSEEAD